MNTVPLDQLGWRWRDHKAALWWLGLLCRRSEQFYQAVAELSWSGRMFIWSLLWAHFLPYFIFICVAKQEKRTDGTNKILGPESLKHAGWR